MHYSSGIPRRGGPGICAVAAKKNGPPTSAVAATTFRVRFKFSLPQRRMARLQNVTTTRLHRFLILGLDLGIDARFHPETSSIVHRFLISGPDLGVDASFAGFLAARRGGFAQSLRSFAGSLAARRGGPCKDGIYQGVARPGGPLFRFVGSGLVKASFRRPGPPKRNQHRLCDADSLIISALR